MVPHPQAAVLGAAAAGVRPGARSFTHAHSKLLKCLHIPSGPPSVEPLTTQQDPHPICGLVGWAWGQPTTLLDAVR